MQILVGIPAFNVEKTIADIVQRAKAQPVDEVVVVNDGSSDSTGEILSRIEGITVINHKKNRGYGEAQKTILDYFKGDRFSKEDIVIFLHGDGEMLPEEIIKFSEAFAGSETDYRR